MGSVIEIINVFKIVRDISLDAYALPHHERRSQAILSLLKILIISVGSSFGGLGFCIIVVFKLPDSSQSYVN